PLVDGPSDTLIFPNENGLVYTLRLNTVFDLQAASLRIDPEYTSYRYKMGNQKDQGIESSMAIYGHYGYFNDNSGIFHCIDLNRMVPVWSRQLEDDSDVTPLLKQEADRLVVYTGTEVDWQKGIIGVYQGTAFVYKLDAMTGEILWEQTVPCYTKKAADHGDDINGGVMGTPIMGKRGLEGSVIFSFCMTNGVYSGNSLIAFDETDGSVLWEYQMTHYTWSSPVDLYDEQGNGYIVIPDSQSQLHLLDGKTGQLLDVLQLVFDENGQGAGNIESSCAVFNNQLVIGTRGNIIAGVTLH
ncbi:MAG: PQQ-binding-like beta-propeller repeat protein, partial [Bacteroidales bacterium]|nr:PQQ-binding-like beta-propeller repeat protein [Bacteroidales bacterium]